jgi:polyphosphate kinase
MSNEDRQLIYTNRELSWIQFNERVLEESEDESVPLYERLGFIAIFQSNLDEFFMVRVGSLFDQTLLKQTVLDSKTNLSAKEQLEKIYRNVRKLLPRKDKSYHQLASLLNQEKITHVSLKDMSDEDFEFLKLYFEKEIMPLISPQIIDKRQPFPFLKNKEIYVGVHLSSKSNNVRLGIIAASGHFNRLVYLPSASDEIRFVLVEDLIWLFAEKVFHHHQILEKMIFRITRNADIDVEDEMVDVDFDYRDAMQELLKKRRKLAPVRLEISSEISPDLTDYFCNHLTLSKEQIFVNHCPLDLSFVYVLEDKVRKKQHDNLFFVPLTPQVSNQINEHESMIAQIQKKDIIFHYPYNAIKPFIDLLNEAAADPDVVSVKITLYRVAKDSKVVNALINAAENGKDVNVVVELRARFDEENNIDWSKRLEEAGCNVIYGLPGYKVHSKLLLITRRVGNKIQYITQIGTGNYNEKTSRLYTDLSLMTANPEIGADASVVFNSLFMGSVVESSTHLLVAPLCFKPKIIELIDQEIAAAKQGEPARIILKMNSLTDKVLIDKLIEASCAGVHIRMIVRGICCFKPGVPGYTENIQITSIVGRFLEHSRIFVFGTGSRQKIYLSSADFMTRNTERRVEVAAPIYSPDVKEYVLHILDVMCADNQKARQQDSKGIYHHCSVQAGERPINAQETLYREAYAQAESAQKAASEKRRTANIQTKKGNWFTRLFRRTKS